MEKQLLVAQQRAVQIKGDRYGVEFQYEINENWLWFQNNRRFNEHYSKNEIAQNLCPFNSQNDLLGYDMLLAEVKHISIKPVDEQDMIFVHFIVNNTSQSFLLIKINHCQECINKF